MAASDDLFRRARNCLQLAENAHNAEDMARYLRMAQGLQNLAEMQAWLDGELPHKSSGGEENAAKNVKRCA